MKIKVNADQWISASDEERELIRSGLIEVGALEVDDLVIPDGAAAPFDMSNGISLQWNPMLDVCKIGCDAAAGIGFAWCVVNVTGDALAACLALTDSARLERSDHCTEAFFKQKP